MINYKLLFFSMSLILFVGISSCKTKKVAVATKNDGKMAVQDLKKMEKGKMISYAKGACHGFCPEFNMTIFSNGYVLYNGVRNTEKIGLYEGEVPNDLLKKLEKRCSTTKFSDFPEMYRSRIPDLPSTSIKFFGENQAYSTSWKEQCDDDLVQLSVLLETILENVKWTFSEEQKLSDAVVKNQIIVRLGHKIAANDLCSKYRKFGLKTVKVLDKNTNIHLLEFDDNKIHIYKMMGLIKGSEGVIMCETNKRVTTRR